MTTQELLVPRYKCLAPVLFNQDNLYNVGDVFTDDGKTVRNQHGDAVYQVEWGRYPHLFESLPWWKDRKPEDMPEYVKFRDKFYKVSTPLTIVDEWIFVEDKKEVPLRKSAPVTKEEYELFSQTPLK
jgi:hypothetical protein